MNDQITVDDIVTINVSIADAFMLAMALRHHTQRCRDDNYQATATAAVDLADQIQTVAEEVFAAKKYPPDPSPEVVS